MRERKRLQEEADLAFAQALQEEEDAAAQATNPSMVGSIDNTGHMETVGNDFRNANFGVDDRYGYNDGMRPAHGARRERSPPLVGRIKNTGTMVGVGNNFSGANFGGGRPFYSASSRAGGFNRQVPGGSGRLTGA